MFIFVVHDKNINQIVRVISVKCQIKYESQDLNCALFLMIVQFLVWKQLYFTYAYKNTFNFLQEEIYKTKLSNW